MLEQKYRDQIEQIGPSGDQLDAVLERLTKSKGKAKPRTVRKLYRGAIIAAVAAALCAGGAGAAYVVNHSGAFQGFFGDESHPSLQYEERYDEDGIYLMDEERVPVDEELAETLVGAYLPEETYTWQIGEYTLTVESYLLDENTGTAKISCILHRPGGLEGITVDQQTGSIDFHSGEGSIVPVFSALCSDPENPLYGEYIDLSEWPRADLDRSTEDTLYYTEYSCDVAALLELDGVTDNGWKAADGLRITVLEPCFWNGCLMADWNTLATLDLPGLESLPATALTNPETGEPAAVISAIGMKLLDSPYLDYDISISLTFDDGGTYIVYDFANHLNNSDSVVLGDTPRMLFNRLVDPERVASVTIDGRTYAVK